MDFSSRGLVIFKRICTYSIFVHRSQETKLGKCLAHDDKIINILSNKKTEIQKRLSKVKVYIIRMEYLSGVVHCLIFKDEGSDERSIIVVVNLPKVTSIWPDVSRREIVTVSSYPMAFKIL